MSFSQAYLKGMTAGALMGLVIATGNLAAMGERPEEAVEIPAEEERRMEEEREVRPVEEIVEPKEPLIPEVPKPVKETGLSATEKVRLDEIERKRAGGQLTETESDLEKDSLLREGNITL